MGNQKLKWTAEEEETLRAGIEKHGAGKWKNILKDPEFAGKLTSRSNIDLKDKWRNLSVAPGSQGTYYKPRSVKPKEEIIVPTDVIVTPPPHNADPSISPVVGIRRSNPDLSINYGSNNNGGDNKNAPRYDGLIFEALSTLADSNGSDVGSIFNYIEPRHEVPPHFRRFLSSRLRRLAVQGKLLKVSNFKPQSQNFYKIPDQPGTVKRTPPVPKTKETTNIKHRQPYQAPAVSPVMIKEAAITAAFKLVEAENSIDLAKIAIEELNKMTKLAEETELLMELAKEMHEQCSRGEVVFLA